MKNYLTRQELASLIGYSSKTLETHREQFPKYIKRGNIRNAKVLYPIAEVKKWLERNGMEELLQKLDD